MLTNQSADVRTASSGHCSAVVCPDLSATFPTTTHAFNSLQIVCSFNSLTESRFIVLYNVCASEQVLPPRSMSSRRCLFQAQHVLVNVLSYLV